MRALAFLLAVSLSAPVLAGEKAPEPGTLGAGQILSEPVEKRFAHAIRRRTQTLARHEMDAPAAPFAPPQSGPDLEHGRRSAPMNEN